MTRTKCCELATVTVKLNWPWAPVLVRPSSCMPSCRRIRTTASPTAGLPVVPLCAVPLIVLAAMAELTHRKDKNKGENFRRLFIEEETSINVRHSHRKHKRNAAGPLTSRRRNKSTRKLPPQASGTLVDGVKNNPFTLTPAPHPDLID